MLHVWLCVVSWYVDQDWRNQIGKNRNQVKTVKTYPTLGELSLRNLKNPVATGAVDVSPKVLSFTVCLLGAKNPEVD